MAELDLALGDLSKERTPAPLADEFVDFGNQLNRQDDLGSSDYALGHTLSVT